MKRDAAVTWSRHATDFTATHDGKPWNYALVPHEAVSENRTLAGLVAMHRVKPSVA